MTKRAFEPEGSARYQRLTKQQHLIDEVSTVDDRDDSQPGCINNFIKDPRMIQVLRNKGIKELFPIQYRTFDLLFEGEDIIGKDRTGSGKTLAFSLPIIQRMRQQNLFHQPNKHPKFLVVLPTRELTIQVCTQINSLKLTSNQFNVVAVYGGADMRSQIYSIRSGADIIVATPGRLMDLISKDVIRFDALQTVCLDEADEMLNQGFQKDIQSIFASIEKEAPRKTQNLMFSATIPGWIKEMSYKYQSKTCQLIDLVHHAETSASKTVKHYSIRLNDEQPARVIKQLITKFGKDNGRVIVFCQTKRDTDKIGTRLNDLGVRCDILHGDVSQQSRQRTFRRFKQGLVRCVVATNVAARGLDFPQIELVVQTEPPKQIESYIHRCGRTGRVNRDGVAVTLCDRSNEGLIYRIESTSKIRMEKLNIKDLGEDLSTTAVDPMGIRIGLNFPKPSRETEPPPRRKYCEIQRFERPRDHDNQKQKQREREKDKQREKERQKGKDRARSPSSSSDKSRDKSRERDRERERQRERAKQRDNGRQNRSQRHQHSRDHDQNELFVHNLSDAITEKELQEFLKKNSIDVRRVKLLKDVDRRSRGCGFITLGSKKAVADCLLFDGSTIKSSTVRIRNKR